VRNSRGGDAPLREPRVLLRCRRGPDAAGRADRQADQRGRIDEALALDPDTVSTACPYCTWVMPGDAVNAKKAAGQAVQTLEVIDVAQLVVRSVRTGTDESTGSARGDSPARSG
jgi:hypothetical protein